MDDAYISTIEPRRVVVTVVGQTPPNLVLNVKVLAGYVQSAELTQTVVLDSKTAPGVQR